MQPHPTAPFLASSGIDYNIKLWAPLAEEPNFDKEAAEKVKKEKGREAMVGYCEFVMHFAYGFIDTDRDHL